jgi:hypothetical protein
VPSKDDALEPTWTIIFVDAIKGDDSSDGSLSDPFLTIMRAQSEVRKTPVASRPKTTVFLRAGTYYMAKTFELGEQDSGSSLENPVTYAAYNGEDVTISGGMKLELDWKPYNGTASAPISVGKAFMAKLPAGISANFTTLFADNKRQIRARYPNGNPEDTSGMCFSKVQYPHAGEGCNGYLGGAKLIKAAPLPSGISFTARYQCIPRLQVFAEYMFAHLTCTSVPFRPVQYAWVQYHTVRPVLQF